MKFLRQPVLILSLAIVIATMFALPAAAETVPDSTGFRIVSCGAVGANACTFDDMIKTVVRLINYLLSAAGIVAVYHVAMAGFWLMAVQGNPEKLTEKRTALTHAVVGFAIILLSFAFINLAVGLFGITCSWWAGPFYGDDSSLKCLY